ncbi:MAG: putative peptidase family [Rhodocyclaceae bacterium]|nr:putative peptidase family [Rhodocyclaceae bacterium]
MGLARKVSWGTARLLAGISLVVGLLNGCALVVPQTEELRQARPADLPERVELGAVPFFPQHDYQCGPAALAMTLAHSGLPVTKEELVDKVYLPARQGSLQVEMLAAPRRYGMVSYELAPRYEDVLREVAAGTPVIVLQDYGVWPAAIWHYAVVVGYDLTQGELVLRSGEKERLVMPLSVLEYTWKESKYWAMVAVPPDRIPATATEPRYLAAIGAMEGVGDKGAVKTAYTTFLKRWPDNLAAGIGLANAHYALGELKEAEAVLRRTADRHPDSAIVLNNLAQTLSDLGRQGEALKLIDQAVALDSSFAAAVSETREQILRRMATTKVPRLSREQGSRGARN